MDKAIKAYHSITASSEFQEIERLREKASHDEAQALYNAELRGEAKGMEKGREEGRHEFIRNAIRAGKSIDEIVTFTGLSYQEVIALKDHH